MLNDTLMDARLLIVDDQHTNNALLESILEQSGFHHFRSLTDPRQVLSQYTEFQPDLILLDLMMPHLDGFAVMQQLRPLIPADSYLPILVLTADVTPDAKRRALSGGAKDFLTKPLDAVEVVLRVKNLLETRRLHLQLQNQNQILEEKVQERTAQLAESETRYRTLFEQLPAITYIDDPVAGPGETKFVSHQVEDMLGITPDEWIKGGFALWYEAVHPDDQERVMAKYMHHYQSGRPFDCEYRMLARDGRVHWLRDTASLLRDERGYPYLIHGVMLDISERKQAEEALRRRLAELTTIHTVAQRLTQLYTPESLAQEIIHILEETLGYEYAAVLLLEKDTERLIPFALSDQTQGVEFLQRDKAHIASLGVGLGKGITGWVAQHGQSIRLGDVRQDARYVSARKDILSELCVPLFVGEQVIGVVNVETTTPNAYGESDQNILETIAAQIAIAIQNARLFEETRLRLHRLAALREIDIAITENLDLQPMLDVMLRQTTKRLGVDAASILLFDPHSEMLAYAAGRGFRTEALQHTRLSLGDGFAGRAALERQIIHVSDLGGKTTDLHRAPAFADEGFVSYYAVPLIAKGEVKGVLEILHRSPHVADVEWLSFMETLAGQAAIAVDNASLFAETQTLLRQTQAQVQLTRQIIDSIPEGMLVLDRERRLVLVNPTAQTYLSVLGPLTTGDVVTTLDGYSLSDFLQQFSDQHTWRELTLGQPPRIFEAAAQSLTGGEHDGGWVLVLRDVTAERETQTRIQHQERLAAVGQMAAGIAHDFNNVMGAIILLVQLLHRTEELSEKNQNRVDTIIEQARHATNLIRQILDFSRTSVIERRSVDLLPLLKEMVKLLERTLPESIRLELNAEAGEYLLDADLSRLQQVLLNLALNARDAMPDGGNLRIGLHRLDVQEGRAVPDLPPGQWLRLTLADTGCGIPTDILSRIFDPFFTTKAPGQGTGLGLAQVYGIVKQHGGEIAVTSQIGQGTTFTLHLPATTAAVQTETALVQQTHVSKHTACILLVEDQATLRQALQDMLEDTGYRVLTAVNGHEALAVFREEQKNIDLVFSDMVMPEMGGMKLLHALQSIRPDLKIILTTGYPLQEEDKQLLRERAVHWVQKPFFGTDLVEKVQAVLEDRLPL